MYLRLGGRYIFTSHLYSFVLPNTSLPFTYPPFAALLFAPWQRTFSTVGSVQTVWTMCNLAALLGVLVLSVRLVRPTLDRVSTWRLALALSLPALLLNPVLITIGFGQVNLVVTFLVMWDLLSERRIGKRQVPLGIATGLAAAVKLTPLLFVPYLLLTRRWRGALNCVLTFVALRAGDVRWSRRARRSRTGQRRSSSPVEPGTCRSWTTRISGQCSIASRMSSSPER